MSDYIKDIRVVIASSDVPQKISATQLFGQNVNVQSLAGNEVSAVGNSDANRTAGAERCTQLNGGFSIPYSFADFSRLYITGNIGDVFTVTYTKAIP